MARTFSRHQDGSWLLDLPASINLKSYAARCWIRKRMVCCPQHDFGRSATTGVSAQSIESLHASPGHALEALVDGGGAVPEGCSWNALKRYALTYTGHY